MVWSNAWRQWEGVAWADAVGQAPHACLSANLPDQLFSSDAAQALAMSEPPLPQL